MLHQDLHDNWQFQAPDAQWHPAQVPGCIHTDMQRHGLIPDPFYGRNEFDLAWMEERDWSYRLTFTPNTDLLVQEHIELVCEGLDTVATIRLNGEVIGQGDNMFHGYRISVTGKLLPGENQLDIDFASTTEYIRAHRGDFEAREFNDPIGGCTVIRKQQCQFGWDWGPRLVTCGIWRPIYLEGWSANRIESVAITQQHQEGAVELNLQVETALPTQGVSFHAVITLDGEMVGELTSENSLLQTRLETPQLWWPAGQGEQPLYDIEVKLVQGERTLSRWQRRIGLRTVELDFSPDEFEVKNRHGVSLNRFGLRVNGRLIFAKGANWIPAHSFVADLTRADYEPLLTSARDAHMNIIRLWGGGIYEHEAFYDLCDEMGLLVWQDFMFACTLAPAGEEFLASLRREVLEQVTRLRHRACIALWCGNNELVSLNRDLLEGNEARREEYVSIFLKTIPQALEEVSPGATYIHTSPLYSIPGVPESEAPSHDEHDWSVWHQLSPVEYYETTRHRFNSEFGMQSYPSPRVAATFCPPEELNILSPTFEAHQKHSGGNAIIFNYCAQQFRFPKDYNSVSYLSQLNQAFCMKTAIEHFRRCQPECLGAMYWQLNDCWPVASWSSLEFGGGWKAIHHYARRFFAPALVSCKLHGEDKAGIGNRRHNTRGVVELWTTYDAPEERPATLTWELVTLSGEVLAADATELALRHGESKLRQTLDFTAELQAVGKANAVLRMELCDTHSGERLSNNTAFFTAPRFLDLAGDTIQMKQMPSENGELHLELLAPTFKYGVCLQEPENVRFSDNFFHLYAGVPRSVTIQLDEGRRPNLPTVFSLVDTY